MEADNVYPLVKYSYSHMLDLMMPDLIEAQKVMKHPVKNKRNPHFGNDYADLTSVLDAIVPPLNQFNIFFTQYYEFEDKSNLLVTMLIHKSGQWIRGAMEVKPDKSGVQSFMSSNTYCRRYSAQAIVGKNAETDDDGEASEVREKDNW